MSRLGKIIRTFLNFVVSVITVVSSFMSPTPNPSEKVSVTSERVYSIVDAYVCGQGLDVYDGCYYASGAISSLKIGGLAKIDITTGEVTDSNILALPQEFRDKDYDHIGDISVQNGIIYAPVEDKAEKYPLVLLYNADTLEYTGKYYELDATYLTDGIPWCATDENYLYASPINTPNKIAVYNLSDMTFSHTIDITEPVDRVQAGDVYDGKLYLNCDDGESKKTVYCVDLSTEKTSLLFERELPGLKMETEGICVTEENGELVFHIADYNKVLSVFIRTYKLK